jgi:hypothetical protein
MKDKRGVVLVDFDEVGHHPTYARVIESTLLAEGFKVRCAILPHGFLNECRSEGRFLSNVSFWSRLQRRIKLCRDERLFFLYWDSAADYWLRRNTRRFFIPAEAGGIWMNTWGFRKPDGSLSTAVAARRYPFLKEKETKLLVLDERVAEKLAAHVKAGVSFLPELVDLTVTDRGTTLERLRNFKKGRRLLLLIGVLYGVKNIDLFLRVARELSGSNWVFAIIGEASTSLPLSGSEGLSGDDFLYLPQRVATEAEYNSLILEADILWCVYRRWEASSNIVIKAGMLGKPVLVSGGYLNAERVRRFGLGFVVSEEDELEAVKILRSWNQVKLSPNVEEFSNAFSQKAAKACLKSFFEEFCLAADDFHANWLMGALEIALRFLLQKVWDAAKIVLVRRRGARTSES